MPSEPDGPVPERAVVSLTGELVALGPHRRDLVAVYQRWFNDLETLRTLGRTPYPLTFEEEQAWYDGRTGADASFTIYEIGTWRPIGSTSLMGVDFRHRTAEFGIVIGERDARGRGYGTETARLLLDYAFLALGLHNVMLRVAEYNLAGRRAYEKAGFREFGRRRQCHYLAGRLWDDIYMECLASEVSSGALSRILTPDEPRQ